MFALPRTAFPLNCKFLSLLGRVLSQLERRVHVCSRRENQRGPAQSRRGLYSGSVSALPHTWESIDIVAIVEIDFQFISGGTQVHVSFLETSIRSLLLRLFKALKHWLQLVKWTNKRKIGNLVDHIIFSDFVFFTFIHANSGCSIINCMNPYNCVNDITWIVSAFFCHSSFIVVDQQ